MTQVGFDDRSFAARKTVAHRLLKGVACVLNSLFKRAGHPIEQSLPGGVIQGDPSRVL